MKYHFNDKIIKPISISSDSVVSRIDFKEYKENIESVKESFIANKELALKFNENLERASQLIITNKKISLQIREKLEEAAALIIANKEVVFKNDQKSDIVIELITANKELALQSEKNSEEAAELIRINRELPDNLVREIQRYIQGKNIYIPILFGKKKKWGENSGIRTSIHNRNEKIRNKYKSGDTIINLAKEFFLSIDSIKKIIYTK